MRIHLINPSHVSFGIGVITPRWLYVLAEATPRQYGDPIITDETLEPLMPSSIVAGDIVGIGIHTGNALRGYEIGVLARKAGATVIYGGIHATLFPEEAHDSVAPTPWSRVTEIRPGLRRSRTVSRDAFSRSYEGGRVEPEHLLPARWDLMPADRYMWASVQTVRGCPKHCSFCSVWRTDGQDPRQRGATGSFGRSSSCVESGFRFIALADDNFYPVT